MAEKTHGGLRKGWATAGVTHPPTEPHPSLCFAPAPPFLGPWHAQASGQRDTCRSDWAERLATASPCQGLLLLCFARLLSAFLCGRSGRDLSLLCLCAACATSGRRRAAVLHPTTRPSTVGQPEAKCCNVAARTLAPYGEPASI
jgi:hypothetical protein